MENTQDYRTIMYRKLKQYCECECGTGCYCRDEDITSTIYSCECEYSFILKLLDFCIETNNKSFIEDFEKYICPWRYR